MAHVSESAKRLSIRQIQVEDLQKLPDYANRLEDVCIVRLPAIKNASQFDRHIVGIEAIIAELASKLDKEATLVILGEVIDLLQIEPAILPEARYQHWISIKRTTPITLDKAHLPNEHFGALVHTRYKPSLRHTKTRVLYTYCPVCDKTTKDYGGKKHTYHAEGTLLSDVWRDIPSDLEGDLSEVVNRFADLFGVEPYQELTVLDCSKTSQERVIRPMAEQPKPVSQTPTKFLDSIVEGDCIDKLKQLPDNSIDFVFADPPYNIQKQYAGYSDDREIEQYFEWCDAWIAEIARVLKPGRTFSLLNIPLWSVRHYAFASKVLQLQNWITWDALSFPVRLIMPANYTILCFSKGEPRDLPGLVEESGSIQPTTAPKVFNALQPLADGYCLRANCIDKRIRNKINDRATLTDVWGDIHRLKHNSRRVDHPCQLPPQLMYRLISTFTEEGETVLDCFNGAGTTTLSAHQIKRHYIGIEASKEYCIVSRQRHEEIANGQDPFRREERVLTAKNSRVARLPKQKYIVSKKVLQLELKSIAQRLGHIPTREEAVTLSQYPIDYYDSYFISWGEATAAARTTGMSETRGSDKPEFSQLALL